MVCRGGGVWISQTGLSPYNQISDKRAYPPVKGEFEDPVVWRDHVLRRCTETKRVQVDIRLRIKSFFGCNLNTNSLCLLRNRFRGEL